MLSAYRRLFYRSLFSSSLLQLLHGNECIICPIPHRSFLLGRPYRREYLIRRMYRHSKNHRLRTQSKAAVFCLYQSEHVTAKPPSKKQAFLQYAFVPSRHNRCRHFRAASKTKSKPNAAGSVGKERATACARSDFCKKVGASDIKLAPTWWRRGESNSCPKTSPHGFLRV